MSCMLCLVGDQLMSFEGRSLPHFQRSMCVTSCVHACVRCLKGNSRHNTLILGTAGHIHFRPFLGYGVSVVCSSSIALSFLHSLVSSRPRAKPWLVCNTLVFQRVCSLLTPLSKVDLTQQITPAWIENWRTFFQLHMLLIKDLGLPRSTSLSRSQTITTVPTVYRPWIMNHGWKNHLLRVKSASEEMMATVRFGTKELHRHR